METKISSQSASTSSHQVDYAAALRHFQHYHRGRSMRRYCEEEGYDYHKFCKYAREALNSPDSEPGVFVEVPSQDAPTAAQSSMTGSSGLTVREVRIRGRLDIWGDKLTAKTRGWTFRVMEGQQSNARTALGPSRPQRLICSSRRSYIPAAVP